MSDNLNNDFEVVSEFKFVMLPQWLLEMAYEGKPLPSKAIHLYSCLMYYANNDTRQCYPSYETLTELSGMSRSSVHRYLQILLDCGAIVWRQRAYKGFNTSNMYFLPKVPFNKVSEEPLPDDIVQKPQEKEMDNDAFELATDSADAGFDVGDEVKKKVGKDPFWGAMTKAFGYFPHDKRGKKEWAVAITTIKTYTDDPNDIEIAYERYFDYMPGKNSEVRITVSALAKHFGAIMAFKPREDLTDALVNLEGMKDKNIIDM
tara:strand:+ start:183 stop:962 length:780 start_codon:yes stop_codon:yes gene_type:complete